MDGGDTRWVVVLEAATGIDRRSLDRLLELLADVQPAALHCPDRYAVQMQIAARGQPEALFVALSRWRSALATVGQPVAEVVRAEVLSPQEFELDCRGAYRDAATAASGAADGAEPALPLLN